MRKAYFIRVDSVVSRETYSIDSLSVQSQLNKKLKTATVN